MKTKISISVSDPKIIDFIDLLSKRKDDSVLLSFLLKDNLYQIEDEESNISILHVLAFYNKPSLLENLFNSHKQHLNVNQISEPQSLTPLHIACEKGFIKVAQVLIEHGADYKIKLDDKFNAIDIASQNNNNDIVAYISSFVESNEDIQKEEKPEQNTIKENIAETKKDLEKPEINANTTDDKIMTNEINNQENKDISLTETNSELNEKIENSVKTDSVNVKSITQQKIEIDSYKNAIEELKEQVFMLKSIVDSNSYGQKQTSNSQHHIQNNSKIKNIDSYKSTENIPQNKSFGFFTDSDNEEKNQDTKARFSYFLETTRHYVNFLKTEIDNEHKLNVAQSMVQINHMFYEMLFFVSSKYKEDKDFFKENEKNLKKIFKSGDLENAVSFVRKNICSNFNVLIRNSGAGELLKFSDIYNRVYLLFFRVIAFSLKNVNSVIHFEVEIGQNSISIKRTMDMQKTNIDKHIDKILNIFSLNYKCGITSNFDKNGRNVLYIKLNY